MFIGIVPRVAHFITGGRCRSSFKHLLYNRVSSNFVTAVSLLAYEVNSKLFPVNLTPDPSVKDVIIFIVYVIESKLTLRQIVGWKNVSITDLKNFRISWVLMCYYRIYEGIRFSESFHVATFCICASWLYVWFYFQIFGLECMYVLYVRLFHDAVSAVEVI